MTGGPRHWVLTPFRDRIDQVGELVRRLLGDLPEGTGLLMVDDGSTPPAAECPELAAVLADPRVMLLTHAVNRGPGAARNSGFAWLRDQGAETVLLLDSDCLPHPGLVARHLELHCRYPEVACIGGAIVGRGCGYWAALDRVLSWFTSLPGLPAHVVTPPRHLPTTNMSLKLARLPARRALFDERLRTGEDVAFVNELRRCGERLLFSPEPVVEHRDRERFGDFIAHQYRWGLHTYAVRLGLADEQPWRRPLFALLFAAALPLYAVYATWLNAGPLARAAPRDLVHLPAMLAVYLLKGVAVLHGTLDRDAALYPEAGPAALPVE